MKHYCASAHASKSETVHILTDCDFELQNGNNAMIISILTGTVIVIVHLRAIAASSERIVKDRQTRWRAEIVCLTDFDKLPCGRRVARVTNVTTPRRAKQCPFRFQRNRLSFSFCCLFCRETNRPIVRTRGNRSVEIIIVTLRRGFARLTPPKSNYDHGLYGRETRRRTDNGPAFCNRYRKFPVISYYLIRGWSYCFSYAVQKTISYPQDKDR